MFRLHEQGQNQSRSCCCVCVHVCAQYLCQQSDYKVTMKIHWLSVVLVVYWTTVYGKTLPQTYRDLHTDHRKRSTTDIKCSTCEGTPTNRGPSEVIVFQSANDAKGESSIRNWDSDGVRRVDRLVRRALGEFSLRMEATRQPGQNAVFSPISIASALAIVLLGARGVTQTEVAQLLGVTTGMHLIGKENSVHERLGLLLEKLETGRRMDEDFIVKIAMGLFLQEGIKINNTFVNKAIEIYHSEVNRVDFKSSPKDALDTVNNWVAQRTDDHIQNLLTQEPESDTKAVIATALYFNGQWENPFFPNTTKLKPFYIGKQGGTSHNEIVDVDLMVNGAEIPYYADSEHMCTIIGMPYKGGKLTMYVILPDGDVKTFLDNLSSADLENLLSKTVKRPVIFFFPRMHLESSINLVHPLKQMGINSLFNPQTSNLSNIAEGIFVNEAVHKVEIDITEEGTVASAATALTFTRDGSSPVVKVDKPFIFFVQHDETGAILFWGTVIRPSPNYKHNP